MAQMKKLPVSVTVLTKNEEANLGGCLECLSFAAQVVVVDSQSTDKTVAIARAKGADVYVNPWPGYTAQRNFASARNASALSVCSQLNVVYALPSLVFNVCGVRPK